MQTLLDECWHYPPKDAGRGERGVFDNEAYCELHQQRFGDGTAVCALDEKGQPYAGGYIPWRRLVAHPLLHPQARITCPRALSEAGHREAVAAVVQRIRTTRRRKAA